MSYNYQKSYTPTSGCTRLCKIGKSSVKLLEFGIIELKKGESDTHFIIDNRCNAKHLTIGEAFVTPGNWAGFPPHKHDVDNMPTEGQGFFRSNDPDHDWISAVENLLKKDTR